MSMRDLRSEFLGDSLFLLDVLCNSPFSGAVHWVAASFARFFRVPLATRQECRGSLWRKWRLEEAPDTDENSKSSLFICVFYALGCIRVHWTQDMNLPVRPCPLRSHCGLIPLNS